MNRSFGFLVMVLPVLLAATASATSYYFPKFGTPILVGDRLIFAGPGWESQRLICINAGTGEKQWEISNPANKPHPACAVDGRLILTVGGYVESLNPTNGERKVVLKTGLDRCHIREGTSKRLYVSGDRGATPVITAVDPTTWKTLWERPGVSRVLAEGSGVLLCEWETRKPMGSGAFQLLGDGFAGISKSSGKELWRLKGPSASWIHGVAVSNYFVLSLGDSIACVRQGDGSICKKIKVSEYGPGVSLVENAGRAVVWSQGGARMNFTGRVYALSVPEMTESELFKTDFFPTSHEILNDAAVGWSIGRIDTYDMVSGKKLWGGGQWNWHGATNGCIYFSQRDPDAKHTSINRIDIRTGALHQLYSEELPPEMQKKP
jgi:hypothetical protein